MFNKKRYKDDSGNVTTYGALAFIMFLHVVYLTLACFALATDRLVVDSRIIVSYQTQEETDNLPKTIAEARARAEGN